MKSWNKLTSPIKNDAVKPIYDILKRRWFYRFIKRAFDLFSSLFLLILLFLPSVIIGIIIVCDSRGGMFFCQTRVGRYGKAFKIVKFRTMRKDSEGNQHITHKNDNRITKVGKFLRKTHLDEFPQLLNVIAGQMSFIGTRPEVQQFVDQYQNEWYSTLLMRPGITSTASYSCDDEAKVLEEGNADEIYLNKVLPTKMAMNIEDIKKMSAGRDIKILWKTVF